VSEVTEIVTLNRSYFRVIARANGTLQITAVAATIDHGDESDITSFVETQMNNPQIAPILQGGEMRWEASGIVAMLLMDPNDNPIKQTLLRNFLFMTMLSGRFRPSSGIQKLIWADAESGEQPPYPQVPEEWWDALDSDSAPDSSQYLNWFMGWLATHQ